MEDLKGNVVEVSQTKKPYKKEHPKWKFWKKNKKGHKSKSNSQEIVPKMAAGIMIDTIPNVVGLSDNLGFVAENCDATGVIGEEVVCDDRDQVQTQHDLNQTPKRRRRKIQGTDSGISVSENSSEDNAGNQSKLSAIGLPQFNFDAFRQNSITGILFIPFIPLMAVFYVLYIVLMLPFIVLNNAVAKTKNTRTPHRKRRL